MYGDEYRNPNQRHPSPVVSVRLDRSVVDRLDGLAEFTGRSRGFYLACAVEIMLPLLEQRYGPHQAAQVVADEGVLLEGLAFFDPPRSDDRSQVSGRE